MVFFEAAANWADRAGVDISFIRDEYDGWFARIALRDAKGAFSVVINEMTPRKKTAKVTAETPDEFSDRVEKAITAAMDKAYTIRIGTFAPPAQIAA